MNHRLLWVEHRVFVVDVDSVFTTRNIIVGAVTVIVIVIVIGLIYAPS